MTSKRMQIAMEVTWVVTGILLLASLAAVDHCTIAGWFGYSATQCEIRRLIRAVDRMSERLAPSDAVSCVSSPSGGTVTRTLAAESGTSSGHAIDGAIYGHRLGRALRGGTAQ